MSIDTKPPLLLIPGLACTGALFAHQVEHLGSGKVSALLHDWQMRA